MSDVATPEAAHVAPAPVEAGHVNGAVLQGRPKGRLIFAPLSKVREADLAIRKTVDKEGEQYRNLRDSVKLSGIMNPPNAREEVDPLSPTEKIYKLIDGLQRTTAARDVGLSEIPLHVIDVDALRGMEMQFQANLARVDMKPADYSKALVEYLTYNPTVSKLELAGKVGQSEAWIEDRLSLENLHESLRGLVNDGIIKMSNAVMLAKLPADKQADFKEAAIGKSAVDFMGLVRAEKAAIAKAKREGSKDVVAVYVPHPKFKVQSLILSEIEAPNELAQLVANAKTTDPLAIAVLTARWCVNLDPASLEAGEAAFKKTQEEKAKAAQERAAEKAKKKEDAEKAAATATATAV
jgi:ParB/RepB/Spo0J family partition protein